MTVPALDSTEGMCGPIGRMDAASVLVHSGDELPCPIELSVMRDTLIASLLHKYAAGRLKEI